MTATFPCRAVTPQEDAHYHDHEPALRHQHKVVTDILTAYDREQEAKP